MNLLDKNWLGLLIVVALTIFSCEDSNDIGLGLDPDGVRVDVLYAELPLTAQNVSIDSIRTSGNARFWIGKNSDAIFGTTEAKAFIRPSFLNSLPTQAIYLDDVEEFGKEVFVFDSIVLNIDIENVHTNDIFTTQSFEIFQLEDTLFSDSYYLSKFDTPYNTGVSLANFSFNLSASEIGFLEDDSTYLQSFKLGDVMGEELFEIAKDNQGTSLNNNLWYSYKGIAIVPGSNNTALLGINSQDSTSLRIHYHIVDYYEENSVLKDSIYLESGLLNISLGSTGTYYSGVSTDRSGSAMASENGPYNSFNVGDGKVYLQPLSGIFPKINMDTLIQFFASRPNVQINRMEIEVETQENTGFYKNVENLRFLLVDAEDGSEIDASGIATNRLVDAVILTDNGYLSGSSETLTSTFDETTLTYNGISTFFAQLVESGSIEVDHVIAVPQDVTTPDFSVFDEETGFKLKLYYTLPK